MDFDGSRLRPGELIAGGGAVVLLVCMFLLSWYGLKAEFVQTATTLPGAQLSGDGWHGLAHLRWLELVTALLALSLVGFQVALRTPAIPVSVSVILVVMGAINLLGLIYRVLLNFPDGDGLYERKPGAFIGLAAAFAIFYGAYRSLRQEGTPSHDQHTEIETVQLDATGGAGTPGPQGVAS